MFTFKTVYKDTELERVVEEALQQDPSIHINDLAVIAKNGVVTLLGHLQDSASRQRAMEAARKALEQAGLEFKEVVDELHE